MRQDLVNRVIAAYKPGQENRDTLDQFVDRMQQIKRYKGSGDWVISAQLCILIYAYDADPTIAPPRRVLSRLVCTAAQLALACHAITPAGAFPVIRVSFSTADFAAGRQFDLSNSQI